MVYSCKCFTPESLTLLIHSYPRVGVGHNGREWFHTISSDLNSLLSIRWEDVVRNLWHRHPYETHVLGNRLFGRVNLSPPIYMLMPDHRDRTLPRIQTGRSSNLNSKNPTKSVIALCKGPKVDANKSKSLHVGDEYHELDSDRAQTSPSLLEFPEAADSSVPVLRPRFSYLFSSWFLSFARLGVPRNHWPSVRFGGGG